MKQFFKRISIIFVMSFFVLCTAFSQVVVITGDGVRLRTSPYLGSSNIYKQVNRGKRLTYLYSTGNWNCVQYDGRELFVSKDFSYVETRTYSYYVKVNGVHVHLRTGPGTNYPYYYWIEDGSPCYLPKGSYLTYVGEVSGWYKVIYNGNYAWISKQFSKLVRK